MKITEQIERDFIATMDYWKAKSIPINNINNKTDWKGYSRIKHLLNSCAFCEYFMKAGEKGTCKNCPLYKQEICGKKGSIYYKLLKQRSKISYKRFFYISKISLAISNFANTKIIGHIGEEI